MLTPRGMAARAACLLAAYPVLHLLGLRAAVAGLIVAPPEATGAGVLQTAGGVLYLASYAGFYAGAPVLLIAAALLGLLTRGRAG